MKIKIFTDEVYEYRRIEKAEDLKMMSEDDLRDLLKDVVDERDNYKDLDTYGFVLDEVYMMIVNELDDRKLHPHLKNDFLSAIIDKIEDFLDSKGILIPNTDRDRDDPDNKTNFYGDDFDHMMNSIRDICSDYGVIVDDEWEN